MCVRVFNCLVIDNAPQVSGTPETCGARIAAWIEVVSPRPARIAAQIEVLSLRPARNASLIEVVSLRLAMIAAQIEVLSPRPARNAAQIEVLSSRPMRNATQIEVVSPRPVRIAAQIEVLSLRPARNVARIEVVSPRPARNVARIEVVSPRPARIELTVLKEMTDQKWGCELKYSSILCPKSLRDVRTVGGRIADQVDQMSPESSEDYKAGRVTKVSRGIDSYGFPSVIT
ncbi:hypothetical protein L3X38_034205 [Prunus dulcis]|uniref:Uncharacterized protein n=1 Tax=Prunus dulcis TaxID=3755 RepID=A0AAD4YXI2_PRUDU|nr:hypothetical protein L3X38_034205 [Prunus dulcis]